MTQTSRHFGDYDVLLLLDGEFEAPVDVLIHAEGETARQHAIDAWGLPRLKVDVNCFLLRGPNGITLVDAGTGTGWGPAFGHARTALLDAGIVPEQVDRVLLTHLHGDHMLGLLDDKAAFLPRAEILVPQADLAAFTDPSARAVAPEARRSAFDNVERLVGAYGGRLRGFGDDAPLRGIEALPLWGHSPGHTGYLLHDATTPLLLWGDTLHVSALQPADPEIGLAFDMDPAAAVRTRRATLERAAEAGWIVAGGHITGFNRVQRAQPGFSLMPA